MPVSPLPCPPVAGRTLQPGLPPWRKPMELLPFCSQGPPNTPLALAAGYWVSLCSLAICTDPRDLRQEEWSREGGGLDGAPAERWPRAGATLRMGAGP